MAFINALYTGASGLGSSAKLDRDRSFLTGCAECVVVRSTVTEPRDERPRRNAIVTSHRQAALRAEPM